ncbi:MAG: hypothetical protein CL607_11025 [Anaerolineaceae bacterium]|nr:hypothetical protein [Anaerolineaceae bacterium]
MTRCIHTASSLDDPISVAYDEVVDALTYGDINEEVGLMRMGSNYTFLVRVRHEEKTLLGVYKPRMGERPLWDFPEGTLCQREAAAYVVSDALGWDIVPPTLMRQGTRGEGSLQAFIDHDPQRHYFTLQVHHDEQLQRISAFDALINNADRKGGHCLLDADDHIWGIDQGLCFHAMDKLRTVIWDFAGQPIPEPILTDLQRFRDQLDDDQDLHTLRLNRLIEPYEVKALNTRLSYLLDEGIFPMPGPGPNRPWPAI